MIDDFDVIAYITDRSEVEIVVLQRHVKSKRKEFFERNDLIDNETRRDEKCY
jgi:hypothetical protein